MSNVIRFAIWSPDEATFRQSWITAGILLDEPGYQFSPEYPGVEITATQGWGGVITYPTGDVDQDGKPVMAAIPGWHCNATITGPLVAEMTYGLPQTDAEGNPLNIFDRTWATDIFQLIEQPADPETGFPAGYRNSVGVTYVDMRDISTPANVRQ